MRNAIARAFAWKFITGGTYLSDPEWEAEGRYCQIKIGRIVIELSVAKVDREIAAEAPDAR